MASSNQESDKDSQSRTETFFRSSLLLPTPPLPTEHTFVYSFHTQPVIQNPNLLGEHIVVVWSLGVVEGNIIGGDDDIVGATCKQGVRGRVLENRSSESRWLCCLFGAPFEPLSSGTGLGKQGRYFIDGAKDLAATKVQITK